MPGTVSGARNTARTKHTMLLTCAHSIAGKRDNKRVEEVKCVAARGGVFEENELPLGLQ